MGEKKREEIKFKVEHEWTAHGFTCRVVLNQYFNIRLGYVRVPKEHPFYRAPFDKPIALEGNVNRMQEEVSDLSDVGMDGILSMLTGETDKWIKSPSGYLKIHGGIGFSDDRKPGDFVKDPDGWWFGWDAHHPGDYMPMDFEALRIIRGPVRREMNDENADKWTVYIRRLEEGEIERNFDYEAGLDGLHYWSLEETILETERLAEQLSIIGLLGVKKAEKG